MGSGPFRFRGFSLLEVVLGLGLAAVLLLTVVLMGTAALSGDTKVGHSQIASSVAEAQLDLLGARIASKNSAARQQFWQAPDGPYSGPGVTSQLTSNGTDYTLSYRLRTVNETNGEPVGGADNGLRQVDLEVAWWDGEKGKPGYGRLALARTRLFRQTDVRP